MTVECTDLLKKLYKVEVAGNDKKYGDYQDKPLEMAIKTALPEKQN